MDASVFRLLVGIEPTDDLPDGVSTPSSPASGTWTTSQSAVVLIAAMSFFVGLIHVNASVDHRREYALYTTVFALIAAVQMGWAVLLVRRPSRQVLIVGALVSLAIAVLWVASRTSGVPLGPRPWVPEAVGVADVAATVGECAIALSVWCVLSAPRVEFARRASSWLAWPLLALLVFGVLFGLSPHAG